MKSNEEILQIDLPNLSVIPIDDPSVSFQYILKSKDDKIVAVGWKVNEEIDETLYRLDNERHSLLIECKNSDLIKIEDLNNWKGLVFVFNNKNIWHCNFNSINPTSNKELNLENFIKELKHNFPELMSESERNINEIQILKAEHKRLENSFNELEKESAKQNELIKQQEEKSKLLEEKLAEKQKQIETENNEKIIFQKANSYLSELVKESILNKLTQKQIETILKILNGNNITKSERKLNLHRIEVNLDLFYPDVIVKIPTTQKVNWDSESDIYHFPTFEYELIQKNGNTKIISINEINTNPNSIFGIESIWLSNLMGCTWLSLADFSESNNNS